MAAKLGGHFNPATRDRLHLHSPVVVRMTPSACRPIHTLLSPSPLAQLAIVAPASCPRFLFFSRYLFPASFLRLFVGAPLAAPAVAFVAPACPEFSKGQLVYPEPRRAGVFDFLLP